MILRHVLGPHWSSFNNTRILSGSFRAHSSNFLRHSILFWCFIHDFTYVGKHVFGYYFSCSGKCSTLKVSQYSRMFSEILQSAKTAACSRNPLVRLQQYSTLRMLPGDFRHTKEIRKLFGYFRYSFDKTIPKLYRCPV